MSLSFNRSQLQEQGNVSVKAVHQSGMLLGIALGAGLGFATLTLIIGLAMA